MAAAHTGVQFGKHGIVPFVVRFREYCRLLQKDTGGVGFGRGGGHLNRGDSVFHLLCRRRVNSTAMGRVEAHLKVVFMSCGVETWMVEEARWAS